MMNKKTLVLGASDHPYRYSYLAINALESKGHDVIAIGKRSGHVGKIKIETQQKDIKDLDTVSLYLNPGNQKLYYDYIISLLPKRIIFNPGAENEELADLAMQHGIETKYACTLVMLSTGLY
jgi:predicted CoA-binding protein